MISVFAINTNHIALGVSNLYIYHRTLSFDQASALACAEGGPPSVSPPRLISTGMILIDRVQKDPPHGGVSQDTPKICPAQSFRVSKDGSNI